MSNRFMNVKFVSFISAFEERRSPTRYSNISSRKLYATKYVLSLLEVFMISLYILPQVWLICIVFLCNFNVLLISFCSHTEAMILIFFYWETFFMSMILNLHSVILIFCLLISYILPSGMMRNNHFLESLSS